MEQIHRRIRVKYFETALPQTRNDLYKFVKDIEEKGGWPYIERMKLRSLLQNLGTVSAIDTGMEEHNIESQGESSEV